MAMMNISASFPHGMDTRGVRPSEHMKHPLFQNMLQKVYEKIFLRHFPLFICPNF